MENILRTLVDNVRNVAKLESFPTHRLRIQHAESCIPCIIHETRYLATVRRYISNDSRLTVLRAIEKTVTLIKQLITTNDPFLRQITEMKVPFATGLRTFHTLYETDVNVSSMIDRLVTTWEHIFT